jgi:glycine cleavage system H protein
MDIEKIATSEIFYTKDHEWINFQDIIAYTGVCSFKLLGYKEIHEITFSNLEGFKKKGDRIATIKYNDYEIVAHMPVNGQILNVNRELLFVDKNILLRSPEKRGWIALIMPAEPHDRADLLRLKQYETKNKFKNVK